jgi:hypothetical protein
MECFASEEKKTPLHPFDHLKLESFHVVLNPPHDLGIAVKNPAP